jgi:hypothetical protein
VSGCHECCGPDASNCAVIYEPPGGCIESYECITNACVVHNVPDGTDPNNFCTGALPNCCSGDCGAC